MVIMKKKHATVFHPVCYKPTFLSRENMTVSAANLSPAVCVSDVMNKASM